MVLFPKYTPHQSIKCGTIRIKITINVNIEYDISKQTGRCLDKTAKRRNERKASLASANVTWTLRAADQTQT